MLNKSLNLIRFTLIGIFLMAEPATATGRKAIQKSETISHQLEKNDFPTLARVEYVTQCMQEQGGQNYNNLYHCVCAVDKLASLMTYQEYSEALTFTYMFDTPGDKGGEFRDPPKSKLLREKLKASKQAITACFPEKPASPVPAVENSPAPKTGNSDVPAGTESSPVKLKDN